MLKISEFKFTEDGPFQMHILTFIENSALMSKFCFRTS